MKPWPEWPDVPCRMRGSSLATLVNKNPEHQALKRPLPCATTSALIVGAYSQVVYTHILHPYHLLLIKLSLLTLHLLRGPVIKSYLIWGL